jgi:tetratricopeptide (TPR) repeat protein
VSLAAVAKALGTTEEVLEAGFRGWAEAQVKAKRADLDFDAAEAEARRRQRVGDWTGMAAALKQALAARPGDPQTLFNLASAQMRASALDDAEANLKALLSTPLSAEQARFRLFGHYQLGRVYDLAGKRERALEEYRRVLELPDEHDAHALARQRIASPATPEHLE